MNWVDGVMDGGEKAKGGRKVGAETLWSAVVSVVIKIYPLW